MHGEPTTSDDRPRVGAFEVIREALRSVIDFENDWQSEKVATAAQNALGPNDQVRVPKP